MKYLITTAVAVGFMASALPTFAAECSASNAKLWQDAFNRGDASGVAALYTPDAIEVTPGGIRTGAQAVKQRIEDGIKQGTKNIAIAATKCDLAGPLRIAVGEWKGDGPQGPESGYWTSIEKKDGEKWKIDNLTVNETPPPPPESAKSAAK